MEKVRKVNNNKNLKGGLVINMSLSELLEHQQKCSTRVLKAEKRSREAMEEVEAAKSDYNEAHSAVAQARSVPVTWDQFFELALNPDNYVQVKVEDPLREWKNCSNSAMCHYADGNTEDKILELKGMYHFDTVDKDFEDQFTFCDRCIDSKGDEGLEGYVEWWFKDMADDWSDFRNGQLEIRVDPEELSDDGKGVIDYVDPKKRR